MVVKPGEQLPQFARGLLVEAQRPSNQNVRITPRKPTQVHLRHSVGVLQAKLGFSLDSRSHESMRIKKVVRRTLAVLRTLQAGSTFVSNGKPPKCLDLPVRLSLRSQLPDKLVVFGQAFRPARSTGLDLKEMKHDIISTR